MKELDLTELEKKYQISSPEELLKLDEQYRAYLEEKIKQDPNDIQAHIYLGILLWEPFHDDKNAIKHLEKALQHDPKNIDARFWLATCCYHDYCDYSKAMQLLLEAIQIDPNRADCLSLLAAVVIDANKAYEEALNYLVRAAQNAPDWPMLYFQLASLYLELNDGVSAELQAQKIKELASASRIRPRNAIEDYYESIVTGRSKKNISEGLDRLNERIRLANC